jgi:malto-oligosyltrehalose synthase/4-alpha-glucanotransferase
MYNPVSTYRLQFNKDFTLEEAHQLTEYFHLLGTGTIYASPVFAATPGSTHGYDVTNPHKINPETGTEEELKKLTKSLKNKRIGWIQDIVPNHMAFNHHNKWLMDVLEKGRDSEYSGVFDIDRQHPHFRSKLMVPFLGDEPETVLANGDLKLIWGPGAFRLSYFTHQWPVRFESFLWLMEQDQQKAPGALSLLLDQYRLEEKPADYLFQNGEWERFKEELHQLCNASHEVLSFFKNLASDTSANPDSMKALSDNQHYKLAFWKETEQRINYRRFFTVNDLICLCIEDEETFNLYHREIRRWLNSRIFDGLRIDHVDGLLNPNEYLSRLRKLAGNAPYISVEKILEDEEVLPEKWPVQGTSGYDFMQQVNNLFTRRKSMPQLHTLYHNISGMEASAGDLVYQSKQLILKHRMQAEWNNLTTLFLQSHLLNGDTPESFNKEKIKQFIGELLLAMPVYRLYPDSLPLSGQAQQIMTSVFAQIRERSSDNETLISIFKDLLFAEIRTNKDRDERILKFLSRLMQLSGPLMAKGIEDTAMYRYNGFIAHNKVGDSLDSEGISVDLFHKIMQQRQKQWPLTINATSTHDTKRGEDVRARLNIISEIPDEWEEKVVQWIAMNRPLKATFNNRRAPSPSEEYLIYQTLLGVFPFDGKINKDFMARIFNYIEKALREAKENTTWNSPNLEWEEAVKTFIQNILKPGHPFYDSFFNLQQKIAHYGVFNSLSQLALKCTCPGIPDIYRGTEMWDLSLADPDNRRPVDFFMYHRTLKNLKVHYTLDPARLFQNLENHPENGHIKMWLTHRLLRYRKENPILFAQGEYIPLKVKGILKKHVAAFARRHKDVWHISIVPLFISLFENHDKRMSPGDMDWKNTKVILPDDTPDDWLNIYTGRPYSAGNEMSVSEVFKSAPVGIFHADLQRKARAAGILMHITSLPGRFATGDFGPGAYRFVDFLEESGHAYWQVLPFTQTSANAGWSPYSPPSAYAGNILFISPHKLAEESLISKKELKEYECAPSDKANFTKALTIREQLTQRAWENFMNHCSTPAKQEFHNFCNKEKHWIHDYALFTLFKKQYKDIPWSQWPAEIRDRDHKTLEKVSREHAQTLELEKYRQYLFAQQWQELKLYANHHGIRIIGDAPIYVSYDNADVWSNPHLFKLSADKKMKTVAGVPPDYFSKTGQLWNMPVYDWKKMEKEDFKWWIQRLRKNLELYDVVRLDHFRGFQAYWEVPSDEETAENGAWSKGPGKLFFNQLQKAFPNMPFIAEDLGEIDEEVYKLRDDFDLPGMSILQFAFGDDSPDSVHAPHNHTINSVVYSGTHDNNTARGWYLGELNKAAKKRLKLYTGKKVKSKNIHRILTRLAWASQAKLVIIPLQDLTGLGGDAQMNHPSVAEGNWIWRIKSMDDLFSIAGNTRELLGLFAR